MAPFDFRHDQHHKLVIRNRVRSTVQNAPPSMINSDTTKDAVSDPVISVNERDFVEWFNKKT